ncbi:MAG: alpha-2-macroglobulin, partial [Treponema sp.]|nr:alpha-2-macroglobulin [Treponema sp.]
MKTKPAFYFSVLAIGMLFFSIFSCKKDAEGSGKDTDFSGSFVERGRPVPELSDYRVVYYEPVAQGEGGSAAYANIQESDAPFVIADYGPRDELPGEIKKPAIYVVFSQPVVPLAKLGDPIKEGAELFTVEPPIAGTYRWYGTKLLSFEPDAENLPQQRYTITVSDRIKSLGGKSLEGERSFSFETERLSIMEWNLGEGDRWIWNQNVHPEDARYIRLVFTYPVNLNEIAKWIEVRANGKTWPFTLSRPVKSENNRFAYLFSWYKEEQLALLTINETFPLDTDVTMELKEGARSEPGWLGTRASAFYNYHTLLPFKFENAEARSYSQPRTKEGDSIPVYLRFNQDVEPEGAEKFFSVDGMPSLSKENVHVFGSTVIINNLPLEYQKTYYVRIASGLKDLYGRVLGGDARAEVPVGGGNSYVYIHNQGSRMLEAGFSPKIVWETQNPVSIQTGIAAAKGPYELLPLEKMAAVDVSNMPQNSKRYFMEDLSPFLNAAGKGSAALRWNYQYKPSWDNRFYTGNSWLTVQVTNIGITVRYAYNMVLVWATHLSDGTAAANAEVELMNGDQVIVSKKTDAQGLAVFEFQDGEFQARFSEPEEIYYGHNDFSKGFRVRASEGAGNTRDAAEFVPNDSHNSWRFDVQARASPFAAEQETPVVFLYTDRGLYRPGETVTFRAFDRGQKRSVYEAYRGPYHIEAGSQWNDTPSFAELEGVTTANGGSTGSFTIPENVEPGQYQLMYIRGAGKSIERKYDASSAAFTVANFERLRFESSVRFQDTAYYMGDKLGASLSASWLSGGSLSGAPYTWYMTRETAWFSPSGASNVWRNWRFGPEYSDGRYYIGQGDGTLGPDGKAEIYAEAVEYVIEGAVYNYRIEASVQDAARQEIAASDTVLVHPASFYIAARIDSGTIKNAANSGGGGTGRVPSFAASNPSAYFLNADKPATLSWALVSPEGEAWNPSAPVSDLSIKLIHHEWKQAKQAGVGGRVNLVWERVEETVEERSVKIEANAGKNAAAFISGVLNFTPAKSGLWEVRVSGKDQKERIASTNFRFYVSGAGWVFWGSDDTDSVTLTADKTSYSPGETAKVLVRSPLEKGKYLLTLEREGVISQKIIELEGSALTIDIPIEESYLPIVYAAISSYTVRTGPPDNTYFEPDLDKPKGIFGVTPIYVSAESRNFQIEIENSKSVYRPAEEAEARIKVLLNGKPAPNTEVSFMAVDRGVVDLINYHVPDPARFFYDPSHFPLGVRGADSRSLLIDPVTYSLSDLQGGDNGGDYGKDGDTYGSLRGMPLEERKDFRPTACFEPFLVTGPDGTVAVKFRLPDSLTTYRCTAVAAGIRDFGIKEQDLRVSAPLTAVAALPRKLRWRDTGSVSLILTNLENKTVEAKVELAASPSLAPGGKSLWDAVIEVDGANSKTVKILPGASSEVRFRVAAVGVGEAQLAFTLNSPEVNEKILRTLVVDRPNLTETVTTIGNLGAENSFIEEGMILPSLVPEGTGSVSVTLSASRLAALKEAVAYLLDYPYGCLEQKTARLLPIVAFGEYLDAFELDSPLKKGGSWNAQKLVEEELEQLAQSQSGAGSFPYWPGGNMGDIFVSLRMAHIAALVKAKGWNVPASLDTRRLLSYITTVSGNMSNAAYNDPFLKGYSLWIRAMYGERITTEINVFLRRGDEAGVSGWAFAGLAALELGQKDIASQARDRVRRFIRPGARSLDLQDTYEKRGYWGYDTDRYALALMLYHALNPADDMTTRLAASLIERQRRGAWGNTVSSFWAILALGKVADSESAEWKASQSSLQAGVSLGNASLLNAEFSKYGGTPVSYNGVFQEEPLSGLARDALLPLRIERSGAAGTLFYTASLRYGIPAELA